MPSSIKAPCVWLLLPMLDFSLLRNLQSVINPDPKISSKSPPIPFNAPTAIDPSGV